MKRQAYVIVFVIAALMLHGCLGLVQKPQQAKEDIVTIRLTADSGYLSKGQISQFLAANQVSDTLATWWKQWKPNDTMGKYYRTDSGYMMCVLTTDEAIGSGVEVNKLIEINKKGELVNSEEFTSQYCDLNRRTEALKKAGKYFVTFNCGQGPSFGSSSFKLFRSLKDRATADVIVESYYEGAPNCKKVFSDWLVKGDTCLVTYTADNSIATDSGCVVTGHLKVSVRYIPTPTGWISPDSAKLKLLHLDLLAGK